jgi:hypothetical protein
MPRPGWAPDPLMVVGIRSPDGLVKQVNGPREDGSPALIPLVDSLQLLQAVGGRSNALDRRHHRG